MKKEIRQAVHSKYDGHCAYCGKEIAIKDMQVDHIEPQRNWDKSKTREEINSFENLNPSCRRCNHYKRANNLEAFQDMIKTLHERTQDIYINKVAEDYGIIKVQPRDGKFYFEIFKMVEIALETSEEKQERLHCTEHNFVNGWDCFRDCACWNGKICTKYENLRDCERTGY